MGIRHFSLALALGLLALLALLASAGCNATGLREPSTATSISAHASATDVAQKPPSTQSPVEWDAPTPQLDPTAEPVATQQPQESPTTPPTPLRESVTAIAAPTLLPGAERTAIFEDVWRTVDENYLY